jgi:hypothetical protein
LGIAGLPDKRTHRGPHPEDAALFAPDVQPRLRAAIDDLSWLLTRRYSPISGLKLVGDRYELQQRQRIAVSRCACSDAARDRRLRSRGELTELPQRVLLLDGYNVLTTVEAALAGGVILQARDGCYRDMASVHGTWRKVQETAPAVELLGKLLHDLRMRQAIWYLDRPVSNSGRLKTLLSESAARHDWPWTIELVPDPDSILGAADELVATADSGILDRCIRWVNLARETVERFVPEAIVVRCS